MTLLSKTSNTGIQVRAFFWGIEALLTHGHRRFAELADKVRVTLIEALPNVLPMFSKVRSQILDENKLKIF